MNDGGTCLEFVSHPSGFGGRDCGRPVKRDGLCGVHAAAKERREKNDAARRTRAARTNESAREARDVALVFARAGYEAWGDSGGVHLETETAKRLALLIDTPEAAS